MVSSLFTATAILYGVACALYLAFLFRGEARLARVTNSCLGVAVTLHVLFIVAESQIDAVTPFGNIHRTLATLSLGIVVAFLVAAMRYRVTILGAFITPLTLLFFLASGLGSTVEGVPPEIRSALLPFHIGVNVLGVVAFALAFASAVAYIIQERMLRQKQLGGVFQRLPALDILDSFSYRAVLVGFPLLTLGTVTGAIWAVRSHAGAPALSIAQGFGLLTWFVYATVLGLRIAAGWQGRRAAVGTIIGFVSAVAVLATYFVQAGGQGG